MLLHLRHLEINSTKLLAGDQSRLQYIGRQIGHEWFNGTNTRFVFILFITKKSANIQIYLGHGWKNGRAVPTYVQNIVLSITKYKNIGVVGFYSFFFSFTIILYSFFILFNTFIIFFHSFYGLRSLLIFFWMVFTLTFLFRPLIQL